MQLLAPSCLLGNFNNGAQIMQVLEGMERRYAPLNDWLHDYLREHTTDYIPSLSRHTMVFDSLEILIALNYAYKDDRLSDRRSYWAPPGAFAYRPTNRQQIIEDIEESLSTLGDDSPYVLYDLIGDSADMGQRNIDALKGFVPKLRWF